MTLLMTLIVFALFTAVACVAGRWGADSRPRDPEYFHAEWPFARHDG